MSVLFVSNFSRDAHLMPVAQELVRRGIKVFAFNPADFPGSATISTEQSDGGQQTVLSWNGEHLDLSSVRSVWYRRPDRFELPESLLPSEAVWLRGECANFVDGVWANTDALWVSDPHQLRRASLKIVQLQIAEQLGFRLPQYLVTNDPFRAREFVGRHPEGVVVKTLSTPAIMGSDNSAGMVYTHRLTAEDLDYLGSVAHGPTQFQAFVSKRRDVRVTVIGDRLFAVGLESARVPDAMDDFRKAEIWDIPHVPVTIPESIERGCLELVRRLGLRFGAIDLLETPDGEHVFLEINPNGQWLWLEEMTGLPLVSAMADLLECGVNNTVNTQRHAQARKPVTLQVGEHAIPLDPSLRDRLATEHGVGDVDLVGTRVWLERKAENLLLHVGDTQVGDE